jgi:ABC-type maltose transport system permease subunit
MVSPMVMLVPIYGLVAALRLLDTHVGLVLVYASLQLPSFSSATSWPASPRAR